MAYLKTKNGLSFRDDAFATFVANLSSSKLSSKVIAAIRKNPRFHRRDKLLETILHKAEESATKVAADTMPSPLDTDNAWIELTVYIIPCRKVSLFCEAILEDSEIAANHEWSVETNVQSFLKTLQSMKMLSRKAERNYLKRDVSMRNSGWKAIMWHYKREISLAVSSLVAYAIGGALLLAGLTTAGLGVIVGTSIISLILALINYKIPY